MSCIIVKRLFKMQDTGIYAGQFISINNKIYLK